MQLSPRATRCVMSGRRQKCSTWLVCNWLVASLAGRTGCAVSAGMRTFSRLILVNLAYLAAAFAKRAASFRSNNVNSIWLFHPKPPGWPDGHLKPQRPQMASAFTSQGISWLCSKARSTKNPAVKPGSLDPDKIWARSSEPYKPQFSRLLPSRQCKRYAGTSWRLSTAGN